MLSAFNRFRISLNQYEEGKDLSCKNRPGVKATFVIQVASYLYWNWKENGGIGFQEIVVYKLN